MNPPSRGSQIPRPVGHTGFERRRRRHTRFYQPVFHVADSPDHQGASLRQALFAVDLGLGDVSVLTLSPEELLQRLDVVGRWRWLYALS